MKQYLRAVLALFIFVIMLANSLSVSAIEFEAETVYNSVFVIYSGDALGSGFAIGENCIVTNAHVISNKDSIQIATYTGEKHNAFLLAIEEKADIALLCVDGIKFTPLKTSKLSTVNIGDDVYAIGAPKSLSYTLTKGVVSAKDRKVKEQTFIQTDAAINSGNSGGPLLNAKGEVIGVNSYKMTDSEGISLAITIDTVLSYIKSKSIDLNENGNVVGDIPLPDKQDNKSEELESKESKSTDNQNGLNIIILCALIVSAALNIFLIILLIFEKRKNLYKKIDPSERTDFDIDILE